MLINKVIYTELYEKLLFAFAKNECNQENIDLNNVRIWNTESETSTKKKPDFLAFRILKNTSRNPEYFYRLYNQFKNDGPEANVSDGPLCAALEYLGYALPADHTPRRLSIKAEMLYRQFLEATKDDFLQQHNEGNIIPKSYIPIIRHLTGNNWWFCFHGHPQAKEINTNGWWLVHNLMTFEFEAPYVVKASKIVSKDPVAERYSDCFGAIDFTASGPVTLAINVKSEHSNLEHIHIKLNIATNDHSDLYLGEFMQHEHDGRIASGCCILLKVPSDIKPESGQIYIDTPCSVDDELPENVPAPFRDIAFYLESQAINIRRTTNTISSTIEGLKDWKRLKIRENSK